MGISREYAFGQGQAVRHHAQLFPERVAQAEREGYDAVILHCCSDPGLAEARRKVRIPVVGPGEDDPSSRHDPGSRRSG